MLSPQKLYQKKIYISSVIGLSLLICWGEMHTNVSGETLCICTIIRCRRGRLLSSAQWTESPRLASFEALESRDLMKMHSLNSHRSGSPHHKVIARGTVFISFTDSILLFIYLLPSQQSKSFLVFFFFPQIQSLLLPPKSNICYP